MSASLANLLISAGAIVIAAILIGIWKVFATGLRTLRDNTSAITALRKDIQEWRSDHSQLEIRVKNLEDWRIATEARRIVS